MTRPSLPLLKAARFREPNRKRQEILAVPGVELGLGEVDTVISPFELGEGRALHPAQHPCGITRASISTHPRNRRSLSAAIDRYLTTRRCHASSLNGRLVRAVLGRIEGGYVLKDDPAGCPGFHCLLLCVTTDASVLEQHTPSEKQA